MHTTTASATIAEAIKDTRAFLQGRPDSGPAADPPVTASLDSGLRCTFSSELAGTSSTDMPIRLGGTGDAPSPGHYLRGAIAACAVTAIAMRAAELELRIDALAVTAATHSDGLAFLGIRDGMVGFADLELTVEISAPLADHEQIDDLIDYAMNHAPVGESIKHAVPTTVVTRLNTEVSA